MYIYKKKKKYLSVMLQGNNTAHFTASSRVTCVFLIKDSPEAETITWLTY